MFDPTSPLTTNPTHVVSHDYKSSTSDSKNSYSARPSSFIGYVEQFSSWKSKMYSHIIDIDEELWDINEDGIDIPVKYVGITTDRKSLTYTRKKDIQEASQCSWPFGRNSPLPVIY